MPWGKNGFWGLDNPWGGIIKIPIGQPSIPPPTIYDVQPNVLEIEGGTILTIIGSGFSPPFVPYVLDGPIGGPYTVVAEGYLFDPDYDLTPTKALPGMPPMPFGTYALQIGTPGGLSNVLAGVLVYKPHADEVVVQKSRSSWSEKWNVGIRLKA